MFKQHSIRVSFNFQRLGVKEKKNGLVAIFNLGNGLDYLQTGLMVIFSMRRLTQQDGQCLQIKKGRLLK